MTVFCDVLTAVGVLHRMHKAARATPLGWTTRTELRDPRIAFGVRDRSHQYRPTYVNNSSDATICWIHHQWTDFQFAIYV